MAKRRGGVNRNLPYAKSACAALTQTPELFTRSAKIPLFTRGYRASCQPPKLCAECVARIKDGGGTMNIFVTNLDRSVTSRDLRRAFSGYGTIIDVRVPTDKQTGRPLGHGHVYLVPERAAREALEELNFAPLRGRPIKVRECMYRGKRDRRLQQLANVNIERRRAHDRRRYTGVNPLAPPTSS